ncbi:hypothetical protein PACTADRAFT_83019 [Pachysolen tannophilus NRRL Y-2460]|uniref:Major facilitator superfamily (MFS) profile domain-containing protein n=1 Tax=Pachysolen tannophilus NRRL Y-2460 TaxID=669874 RepID=A0A1E4U0N4_PACTA|nr:hypothetical protein PACTADRAFT_83019 [Pachysolen tannophilus NRRL Y-2460]
MASEDSDRAPAVESTDKQHDVLIKDNEVTTYVDEQPEYTNKWYDKSLLPGILPRYSDAISQILMVSFVCFLTPGMYNALSGIGGAGLSDVSLADNANVALYSTFATFGFFSGVICNTIGARACLAFGGLGYALYSASLLCYYHTANQGFVIFAGAILGVCAAMLWSAQAQIIMSYPAENAKGRGIMTFWVIFNLGAVIGSIIPLADNINNKGSSVNDGTYIAFLVLMIFGSCLGACLLPIGKVWKADGTRVIYQKNPSIKTEFYELYKVLRTEPKIIMLFPMFFASNWYNTYQQSDFNAGRFNVRTRSLNSLLYWFMQMFGSMFITLILDYSKLQRKTRAKIGWCIITVLTFVIWGGGLAFQLKFTRATAADMIIDFTDKSYGGPCFLFMLYGAFDAVWQSYLYWVMGSLSNNARKLTVYNGFYKGIQSAGAAIIWRIDAMEKPYINIFASSWALLGASLLIAAPLIFRDITNHTEIEKDLADSDETIQDIAALIQLLKKKS